MESTVDESKNKVPLIETAWNDRFPPLNLWNYPPKWVKETLYKDKDVWY